MSATALDESLVRTALDLVTVGVLVPVQVEDVVEDDAVTEERSGARAQVPA